MADGIPCEMEFHPLAEKDLMHEMIKKADILINGTSVGMAPALDGISLVTDMSVYREDLVVYDVIYNPLSYEINGRCSGKWMKKENVIGGKGMLLWQGAGAFELYTGLKMPAQELKEFLAKREAEGMEMLQDVLKCTICTKYSPGYEIVKYVPNYHSHNILKQAKRLRKYRSFFVEKN